MRLLIYKGVMSRLNTILIKDKLRGGVFRSELRALGIQYYKEKSIMGYKSRMIEMN